VGVDRLRGGKAKSKVLILLTDGDCNAGVVDPREAARIAAESGIRLYTIGIGRYGMVPFPQEDEFGNRVLAPAKFRIDEDLLREMPQTGGGRYFHAADSEGLAQVYAEVAWSRHGVVTRETIAPKGIGKDYEPAFDQPLKDGAEFTLLSENGDWIFGHFEGIGDGWLRREHVVL
jgi:hypothetical protein